MRRHLLFYIFLFAVFALGLLIVYLSVQRPFCANSKSCKESFSLNVENEVPGVFDGQTVMPPNIDLAKNEQTKKVLGEATLTGEKHIYVDLTNQTLTAYQGDTLFMKTQISSGKWHPTPTGEFTIWEKVRATRMTGGEGADYYDLPNVPYVMFFGGGNVPDGSGFGLHGTYWHDNFGHPMSHGCVNMRTIDAEKLYDWVDPPTNGNTTISGTGNPGTTITIYGQAPL
jgi:lipoprotein-anchoring transpeptidase ErfK/SrfK